MGNTDLLDMRVDELSPERRLSAWEELKRAARALSGLPPKCREVLWLRRVDELSTREVAQRLGISERTVEGQILKGMRLMTDALFGQMTASAMTTGENRDPEAEHGE